MSKCITAFMFILGGIGCLKAVECYLQHQWLAGNGSPMRAFHLRGHVALEKL